jgi:hypothetical protein
MNAAENGGSFPSWFKYDTAGGWSEKGIQGKGADIIPHLSGMLGDYDFHSDAAYSTELHKYLATVDVCGKALLLYSSVNGLQWAFETIIDATADMQHTYSAFASLANASDDCSTVGKEFYILYPLRKNANAGTSRDNGPLYRRRITILPDTTSGNP